MKLKPKDIIEPTVKPVVVAAPEPLDDNRQPHVESNNNNLSDIVDTIENAKPEISDHAINSYEAKEAATIESTAGLVDRDGNPFDASKHKVDASGKPILTQRGLLSKKAGVKKGASGGQKSFVGGAPTQPTPADNAKIQCRATGVAAANMVITLGVVMGGTEWQPIKNDEYGIDEKSNLETAFGDYFEATGMTDVPPNMALIIACSAYALPRFTMPQTKARGGKAINWFKKKMADRKLKKHNLRAVEIEKDSAKDK